MVINLNYATTKIRGKEKEEGETEQGKCSYILRTVSVKYMKTVLISIKAYLKLSGLAHHVCIFCSVLCLHQSLWEEPYPYRSITHVSSVARLLLCA